jgi:hypothetical protein
MINYVLFAVAFLLSAVAAYYSIVGLAYIFSAAVVAVVIMGSCLELSKVILASWLYRNWHTTPKLLKYYLASAVVVLMFITSMGIFGFLSKAHIDQNLSTSDNTVIIKNLEREIQGEESSIRTAQRSIDILDRLVSEADPKDANFIRNRQKREREALNNEIRSSSDKIKTLNTELTPLRQESLRLEAEVGPIKYVADLIYGEGTKDAIEKAVRVVIIIIVCVFDPLAIAMIVAANHSLQSSPKPLSPLPKPNSDPPKKRGRPRKNEKPLWVKKAEELKDKKKRGIIEVDKDSIVRIT